MNFTAVGPARSPASAPRFRNRRSGRQIHRRRCLVSNLLATPRLEACLAKQYRLCCLVDHSDRSDRLSRWSARRDTAHSGRYIRVDGRGLSSFRSPSRGAQRGDPARGQRQAAGAQPVRDRGCGEPSSLDRAPDRERARTGGAGGGRQPQRPLSPGTGDPSAGRHRAITHALRRPALPRSAQQAHHRNRRPVRARAPRGRVHRPGRLHGASAPGGVGRGTGLPGVVQRAGQGAARAYE